MSELRELVLGLEFCKWLSDSPRFIVTSCSESTCAVRWESSPPPWQVRAQLRFSAVPDDQVISRFIFEGLLTGRLCLRFLQEELPQLFEAVPLNKRGRVHVRQDGDPPHLFRERQIFPVLLF